LIQFQAVFEKGGVQKRKGGVQKKIHFGFLDYLANNTKKLTIIFGGKKRRRNQAKQRKVK
jgi:hypothetical protein